MWISRDSSSASVNLLRSRLVRSLTRGPWLAACGDPTGFGSEGGVGASLEPVELNRAPQSLLVQCY